MLIGVFLLVFIVIILLVSYFAYNIAFKAPKRIPDVPYHLPKGKDYVPYHDGIKKSAEEMLARPCEEVYITAFDGTKLFARYYHVRENAPVQIQMHGYKSSAFIDFCGGSKLALELGHNALVVDQRSGGKSDGKTITFGIKERRDCLSWIDYINKRFGDDVPIILCGLSMGAATVLMANDLELPGNVKGIFADCPFSSPKAIIQKVSRDMHFPPKLMYPFVKLAARLFGGFNLEESSAVTAVQQAKVPILILHGEADGFVPCHMSKEIAAACASKVTLELFPGAGHGLCYMTDPKRYEEATVRFLHEILGNDESK